MKIRHAYITALAAVIMGLGAGSLHWLAKPLIPVGPCQGAMICLSRYARPGLALDDVLVGLVAMVIGAAFIQVALFARDRRASRSVHAPAG
jgi:hypothetical protein